MSKEVQTLTLLLGLAGWRVCVVCFFPARTAMTTSRFVSPYLASPPPTPRVRNAAFGGWKCKDRLIFVSKLSRSLYFPPSVQP